MLQCVYSSTTVYVGYTQNKMQRFVHFNRGTRSESCVLFYCFFVVFLFLFFLLFGLLQCTMVQRI